MATPRWVVVHEGIGPVSPGSKKLLERLVESSRSSAPSLEHIGLAASTVPQARKEGPELRAKLEGADRVLTFGPLALLEARGDQGKLTITSERGRMQWAGPEDAPFLLMPTIDPKGLWADYELYRDFARDVIKWVTHDQPVEIPFPDFTQPRSATELANQLAMFSGSAVVSLDVETTGLKPLEDELMSIGIGTTEKVLIVPREMLGSDAVKDILWEFLWADPFMRVVMHNGKFDLQFLANWWGAFPDGTGARTGDTMLLNHLLDERPVRSRYRVHGLKDIARVRYDVPDYHFDFEAFHARLRGEEGTEPITEKEWQEMYAYHAMDCHLTARLWGDLVAEANEESAKFLTLHDQILAPASVALAEAEFRGIPVDEAFLRKEKVKLEKSLSRHLKALRQWVEDEEFLPSSTIQVVRVIKDKMGVTEAAWPGRTTGAKAYARQTKTPTGEAEIKQLIERFSKSGKREYVEWLEELLEYRGDTKNLSTYVDGLLDSLGPDGRVHPSFNIAGTLTGRLSASGPNMQAIPREGTTAFVRRSFVAPEGWTILEADYSQLEIRTVAELSGDPDLMQVYLDGRDLHLEVAVTMFQKPREEITKEERFMAKAINFGVIYGRSGWAISRGDEMTYAVEELGMERWTEAQGDEYVSRWLAGFPVLDEWLAEQRRLVMARRYTETPFGRKRRFYLTRTDAKTIAATERQGMNTPVQSMASDVCLNAFVNVSAMLDPREAFPISIVHDSIWLQVREDMEEEVTEQVKEIMETPPPQWKTVPLVVDVKRVISGASPNGK